MEPVSNDAGTAIGAAYWHYHKVTKDKEIKPMITDLYYGPEYEYDTEYITDLLIIITQLESLRPHMRMLLI